ncbi:MAG: hypothetical protein SFV81_29815 [Pirellulaceae bacterium]|nr:hypothetical protein [Pirellulaceae bacterium]
MIILRYHRSRLRLIVGTTVFLLSISALLYWLASLSEFQGVTLWVVIALFVGNFALGSYELWSTIRQPRDFECELTESTIRCVCPVARMGSTFDISLDDLIAIEVTSDDTPRVDLLTRHGSRYWLTSNFGNPVRRFVTQLRSLRPQLEYKLNA